MAKYVKKVIAVVLASTMLMSLCSCNILKAFGNGGNTNGNGGNGNNPANPVADNYEIDKNTVYKHMKDFETGFDYCDSSLMKFKDNVIYIAKTNYEFISNAPEGVTEADPGYYDYGGTDISTFIIKSFDIDGQKLSEVSIDMSGGDINTYAIGNNAELYTVSNFWNEESNVSSINRYDKLGNSLGMFELSELIEEGDYFYPSICFFNDNKLYVGGDAFIAQFDENLNLLNTITFDIQNKPCSGAVAVRDGSIYVRVCDYSNDEYNLDTYKLNVDSFTLGEEVDIPSDYSYAYEGPLHDLYRTTSSEFRAYDIATGEETCICNFYNSDIDALQTGNVIQLDDTHILVSIYGDYYSGTPSTGNNMAIYEKVNPEDVVEKEILTIGCVYLDGRISKQVVDFNKTNDQYRLCVIDYSAYNTDDDWDAGLTKLKNDIVAGNCPDVVVLEDYSVRLMLAQKGVFADLSLLISDSGMSTEDFVPNIVKANTYDDKLYALPTAFSIDTAAIKTSVLNEAGGTLTLDKLIEIENQKGCKAYTDMCKNDILYAGFRACYEDFYNVADGTCNFESDEFIKLLEYANTYPDELSYDEEYNWEDFNKRFRENRALINSAYLYNVKDMVYTEKGMFGEEISLVGFPSCDGKNTSKVSMGAAISIADKSEHKDVAWSFVKKLFTEDAQKNEYAGWFPVLKSSFDQVCQEGKEKPFYYDENNNKVEYEESFWIGETELKLTPFDQARVDYYKNFVMSVETPTFDNYELYEMIQTDAAPYFAGEKTAQEVAAVIQSRISIYVSEKQ